MRRLLVSALLLAVLALVGVIALSEPAAEAVGAGDVVGTYALKIKGNGFHRSVQDTAVAQQRLRGTALLTVRRADPAADPRLLEIEIQLGSNLRKSSLDRATPTPAFFARGVLLDDAITAIGTGRADFVNAVTLRFLKKGRKVDGWWLGSFPGAVGDGTFTIPDGFVAGFGATLKGKRLRETKVAPAAQIR